ncbi:TAXI family TRAP transporter solute-binding subunit [Zafaria sp. J156]|uniref:TAXI family TRAP transporter solute-binding subunit n=1 Tax=unclassified Zafaria TaxID=2828765 RepID=UPI002E78DC42|nr:TAXI family TRAP transporter solute-binding subunit [Zafaria sp. J156]MEE1621043.1 TAXI family TRAP transporter solute-binding subunit [Zafaria sp. J156]
MGYDDGGAGGPRPTRRSLLAGLLALPLAASGCANGTERPGRTLRLATGPEGAVYREMGQALAGLLNRKWGAGSVEVVFTDASQENIRLLNTGQAEIGFVNTDTGAEQGPGLRALARVYDSVMHCAVRVDSSVHRLADVDGLVVAGGQDESGTRYTLGRLLERAGTSVELRTMTQSESVRALLDGGVDALFSLTGMPTPALQEAVRAGRIRLVDLADEAADVVAAFPLEYVAVTIPAVTYGTPEPVGALGVPTLLAVHGSMEDAEAHLLTAALYDVAAELSTIRPEALQISKTFGIATVPLPLHPGARAYYQESKP